VKVLVTGGGGFIGSAIVDALVARGDEVVALDCFLPAAHDRRPPDLNPGATWIDGDVRDLDTVVDAVAGVDAVSHQAAMVGLGVDLDDIQDYVSHNDGGTAALVRALHRTSFAGRVVVAGSMVVYGEGSYRCTEHGVVRPGPRQVEDLDAGHFDPRCPACDGFLEPGLVDEDAPVDPRNVYAATKLHQEHLLACWQRESGGSCIALRYHNVYGPRMPKNTSYAGVASLFRSAAARGEAPRVFEDGGQRRDFVHVADVAAANLAALDAGSELSGAFNVASGEPHTVLDMARAVAAGVGGPEPTVVGGYRLGDVRHVVASPARAAAELGFTSWVGFAEGMAAFATAPLRGDEPACS
jgi:dTDP-L-rhamnose 4-epimerase